MGRHSTPIPNTKDGRVVVGTLVSEWVNDIKVPTEMVDVIAVIPVEYVPALDPITRLWTLIILTETRDTVVVKDLPGAADAWGLVDNEGTLLWAAELWPTIKHGDQFVLTPSPLAH